MNIGVAHNQTRPLAAPPRSAAGARIARGARRQHAHPPLRCAAHAQPSHPPEAPQHQGGSQQQPSRREALQLLAAIGAALGPAQALALPRPAAALTVADVTPAVVASPPLPPREQAIVDVFETATYSVVNVFDVALQGRPESALNVEVPEGNGSGVIWDKSGNCVTNYHVLASSMAKLGVDKDAGAGRGKRVAVVTLLSRDGEKRVYDATLVGADKARDLAVLQVSAPADKLSPVELGQSTGVRVGQQVLSIGNPFGAFDHTLTTGVVSALNRDIRSQTGSIIPGGIQTDAAINPGNSGGPLLSSAGKLIGINTAIFTNTGSSAGIGFAIPVDTVKAVVPQLIAGGKAERAGLNAQVASDQVAQKVGVKAGALLQTVAPGGAAAKAGLLATRRGLGGIIPGDAVLAVNGRPVGNSAQLLGALEQYRVGDTVELLVARVTDQGDRQEIKVNVTLQAE